MHVVLQNNEATILQEILCVLLCVIALFKSAFQIMPKATFHVLKVIIYMEKLIFC